MRTLTKYIFKELYPSFLLGIVLFTFILLMDRIFDLANLFINKGVGLSFILRSIIYSLPFCLSLTIPMALLLATLLSFGRFTADSEIVAMKASGINPNKIILPLLGFGLFLSLVLVVFNQQIVPSANYNFKNIYRTIKYQQPVLKLEKQTFIRIQNYQLYLQDINRRNNRLEGVIIYRTENDGSLSLITARQGKCNPGPKEKIVLDLEKGKIYRTNRKIPDQYRQASFSRYRIALDPEKSIVASGPPGVREMNLKEIRQEIKKLKEKSLPFNSLLVELHSRYSIAFAGLIFVLIGAPLGIKAHPRQKFKGLGISIALIFIYYLLLLLGMILGEKGWWSAVTGVWLPNIFLGITGLLFLLLIKH